KNGIFSDVASEAGINATGFFKGVACGDINNDGKMDLYLSNYIGDNTLYENTSNEGTLIFKNITDRAKVAEPYNSFPTWMFDYDNDGDQDFYIAPDAYQANSMYINNGNGYFTEQAAQLGINNAGQGMGVDVTDFNHDGWMDIYITNYHDGNTLYVNDGDGTYTEISVEAGVDDIGQGWGISWTDYDADGDKDIYLANNNSFASVPNVLYRNNGDSTFTIVSTGTVLESPFIGAAIASADLNLDGTEDIVVCNNLVNESPGAQLFWNETTGNNWIGLELEGVVSNKNAIGAVVTLYAEELVQKDVVLGGSGYSQMNSFKLNFGLGQHESVDMIEIQWPNGLREFFYDFDVNQYHSITEGTGAGPSADFNLDGVVGMADLLMLLPKLQSTDPYFDLSEDGQVGTSDLLYFLQEYGH
ncbi:MAG: CRTAC1 family protein, partial [Bacteroidota bacterium]